MKGRIIYIYTFTTNRVFNERNFFNFRNLATIRVLSLGTMFIPKWNFEKRNTVFKYFNDFVRRMNNKVYFTETKPGIFERNARFKLKSNFVANMQYKKINLFGWRHG